MSVNYDKARKHWVVRYYVTNPVTGERKQIQKRGFKTKKEGLRYEESLEEKQTYMSFSQLASLYLDSLKGYANENSIASKKRMIEMYCGAFMDSPISSLSPAMMQKFKNDIHALPYLTPHKNRILQCVKAVSRYGATYYDYKDFGKILKAFPISSDDVKDKKINAMTPDEFRAAMEHCDSEVYRRFFIFLYHTGMRRGEAKALLKADIQGKQCDIYKSIRRNENGSQRLKNAFSRRTITLDSVAYAQIEPLLQTEGEYLFGEHEPLANSTIAWHFNKALKEANLPHFRIHDLRHSFITNAILNGADIVTVSRYVGHSDIKRTLNTYSHLMKDSERRLLEITESL